MAYKYFYHTNNKTAVLAHSHYSDPAFDGDGAVIFGSEKGANQWEYADRLQQFNPEKHKTAWQAAKSDHKKDTATRIEAYLQNYYDDPRLKIQCIKSGTQRHNGYPWYAYGFKFGKCS